MKFQIDPQKILIFLLTLVLLLLAGHIASQLLVHYYPDVSKFAKLERWMNFNREVNFPSLFSVAILFFSSILLGVIGVHSRDSNKPSLGRYGLSFVFLFLSIDEAISIHEMFIGFGRKHLGVGGVFYFSWIIPYGILLVVLIGICVPFLLNLPKHTAIWFVGSGFILSWVQLVLKCLVAGKKTYFQ